MYVYNDMAITLAIPLVEKSPLLRLKVRLNQLVPYFKGSDIIQKKQKMYRRMINRLI